MFENFTCVMAEAEVPQSKWLWSFGQMQPGLIQGIGE